MRTRALLACAALGALALLVAACSEDEGGVGPPAAEDALVGLWTADPETIPLPPTMPEGPRVPIGKVLDVHADGTFRLASLAGGREVSVASGTWRLQGPELALVVTHVDGQPRSDPSRYEARFEGGEIRIPRSQRPGRPPEVMVLRR